MQRITMFGLALVAAYAVVAVSAVSVSASGHEFYASKTGKVKTKATDAQIFKTSAGTLECTEVTGTGEIKEGKSISHKETLTYSGCSAFGGKVSITPAHFEFNANGSARLEKQVIITPIGEGCEILLEPQTVEGMGYANKSGGKVEATADAYKIRLVGTGGACGGESNEATYSGSMLGELEGGTIEWK